MDHVFLSYNPYLLQTQITINGTTIDLDSALGPYLEDHRLQQWLEPKKSTGWDGLLKALRTECNVDEISLSFHGTALDYADLEQLVRADQNKPEAERVFRRIELTHENADASQDLDPAARLEVLKDIYARIQQGPVEAFHTDGINAAFASAMDDSFDILVIATMSAGKSTLINAMLWQDLLPAYNQATTAVITRICDNDEQEAFTVSAVDHNDNTICKDEPATLDRVSELNSALDPNDPEHKRARVKEIRINGNIPALSSKGLHAVFVDTPGGNNALNKEHEKVMNEAIDNEDKSLVLFVFNAAQLTTDNNNDLLKRIANAMRRSKNGKQSRDRFLFVVNYMDVVECDKESYESFVKSVKQTLSEVGITDPNLYLVSARTAKLLRMDPTQLSEYEQDDLPHLKNRMSRAKHALYRYSSLPASRIEEFDRQVQALREKPENQGRSGGIPEVALINSGVPALEAAISEYLQKYAISIKLTQAQNAFMGAVRDLQIKEKQARRWNASKEEFEKAQAEAKAVIAKLERDKTLQETINAIDAIQFDEGPIWPFVETFSREAQNIALEYRNDKKISVEDAQKKKKQLTAETEALYGKTIDYINTYLQDTVEAECNKAMDIYRRQLDTLQENGLTQISGINVSKLSGYKAVSNTRSLEKYVSTHKESYTVLVEADGFFGGIARFFGELFGTDWGYEQQKRQREVEHVNFARFARDMIDAISESMLEKVRDAINRAEETVKELKQHAENQAKQVNQIICVVANDVLKKTSNRDKLAESVRQSESSYRFAEQIIREVDTILTI